MYTIQQVSLACLQVFDWLEMGSQAIERSERCCKPEVQFKYSNSLSSWHMQLVLAHCGFHSPGQCSNGHACNVSRSAKLLLHTWLTHFLQAHVILLGIPQQLNQSWYRIPLQPCWQLSHPCSQPQYGMPHALLAISCLDQSLVHSLMQFMGYHMHCCLSK